jgi:hypothetical protein
MISWRNGVVWWCSRGVEVWAAAATINNSDVATGEGSPKVARAPLLCGGAAGGIGVGVVLQVGCARGSLAPSSQPRGRQWRSGAGSAGQQSTSAGLMEGGSSPEGTKASTKWLGRRCCVSRSTSMGTSGPASTGARWWWRTGGAAGTCKEGGATCNPYARSTLSGEAGGAALSDAGQVDADLAVLHTRQSTMGQAG